jgi:hypothetical protein
MRTYPTVHVFALRSCKRLRCRPQRHCGTDIKHSCRPWHVDARNLPSAPNVSSLVHPVVRRWRLPSTLHATITETIVFGKDHLATLPHPGAKLGKICDDRSCYKRDFPISAIGHQAKSDRRCPCSGPAVDRMACAHVSTPDERKRESCNPNGPEQGIPNTNANTQHGAFPNQ